VRTGTCCGSRFSRRSVLFPGNPSHVAFGVGIIVGGVVVGRGGVIIVVGAIVPGDGWGMGELGVTVGVPGVGTAAGGEIVPVNGGGEGTGILTAGGGENGAAAVAGATVAGVPGAAGRVAGLVTGAAGPGMKPPETFPAAVCVVVAVRGTVVVATTGCPVPATPEDTLPVSTGEGGMAVVAVASESPGGVIWGPEHPAARSSSTVRPARSMILIRSILGPHGT
jgi:hypothetical protein